ncbi:MAG: phosphate-binding protein, partial [Moorellales bacterium]
MRKGLVLVTLVALLVGLLGYRTGGQEAGAPGAAEAPLAGELKLSGSTSVQPLAEELAQAFMAKHPQVR